MRPPVHARAVTALVCVGMCVALLAGACSGDDDDTPEPLGPNPTSSDPGPNSTDFDPGPNPTDDGPVTVSGTLQVTPECLTLQRPEGPLDLRFEDYRAEGDGLADDTGTVVARSGDQVAVAGFQRDEGGACGTRFDVESFVTALEQ
jgi:hypothetical protein